MGVSENLGGLLPETRPKYPQSRAVTVPRPARRGGSGGGGGGGGSGAESWKLEPRAQPGSVREAAAGTAALLAWAEQKHTGLAGPRQPQTVAEHGAVPPQSSRDAGVGLPVTPGAEVSPQQENVD